MHHDASGTHAGDELGISKALSVRVSGTSLFFLALL